MSPNLTPVSHPSTRVRRVGGYGYLPEFLERRVGIDGCYPYPRNPQNHGCRVSGAARVQNPAPEIFGGFRVGCHTSAPTRHVAQFGYIPIPTHPKGRVVGCETGVDFGGDLK